MVSIILISDLKKMIPYKSTRPEVLFQKNFLILIWIQSHPKGLDHYLHKAVDINEHFAIHHLPEGRSFLAYVFVNHSPMISI